MPTGHPEFSRSIDVVARDDLLLIAVEAEEAVGIARREQFSQELRTELDLFEFAMAKHLRGAQRSTSADDWSIRARHLAHAASIARFCSMVDMRIADDPLPLLEQSVSEMRGSGATHGVDTVRSPRDVTGNVHITYRLARELRLRGTPESAIQVAEDVDRFLAGSGAEQFRGNFDFEIAASLAALGQSPQIRSAIAENDSFWASDHTDGWPSRNRHHLAIALHYIESEELVHAAGRLELSVNALGASSTSATSQPNDYGAPARLLVQQISALLTLAETVAATEGPDERAIEALRSALHVSHLVRGKWGVVVRSSSPLSLAFKRLYGDMARVACQLRGESASHLGLEIAIAAKQTGLAGLIRSERMHLPAALGGLVDAIMELEQPDDSGSAIASERTAELFELRGELSRLVSPLFAQMVLPTDDDKVDDLLSRLQGRLALDFVNLTAIDGRNSWYRTLIGDGGRISFEQFQPSEGLRTFRFGDAELRPLEGSFDLETEEHGTVWQQLAKELLPAELQERLRIGGSPVEPVSLVISPHDAVSSVPWQALQLDSDGTQLVQRAAVSITPSLSCVIGHAVDIVAADALVRLVGKQSGGVDTEKECASWGIGASMKESLIRWRAGPPESFEIQKDGLLKALAASGAAVDLLHVAAHGKGYGLNQRLELGEESISAAASLGVRWPPAVFLASCNLGQMDNSDRSEPYCLVATILAAGARTVVAGIDRVDDSGTGDVSAKIAELTRSGVPLAAALRQAQLQECHKPAHQWALLAAFTT